MNLLDRIKAGVLMVIGLLLFSECEDAGEIGLDVNPEEDRIDVEFKQMALPLTNVLLDSVRTDLGDLLVSGAVEDPIFGRIKSTAYTQLNIDVEGSTIPSTDAFYDSAVLHLRYSDFYGFDFSEEQTFEVYQLNDTLFDGVNYLSHFSTLIGKVPLGSVTTRIDPERDTTLTIRIDDEFGEFLFEEAKVIVSDDTFDNIIKGIAIVPADDNDVIAIFDPRSDSTRLSLYYTIVGVSLEEYRYEFNSERTLQYNRYEVDRSNSIVNPNSPNEEFSVGNGQAYLQPGTGVLPVVDFQPVVDFLDSIGTYAINRAELEVIPNSINSTDYIGLPSDVRYVFFEDGNINGPGTLSNPAFNLILSNNSYLSGGTSPAIHVYDDLVSDSYRGAITIFTELLANGSLSKSKVALLPGAIDSFDQLVLNSDAVKVRLYYTTPAAEQ